MSRRKDDGMQLANTTDIRLGACLSGPTKSMMADLDNLSRQCSQCRNACCEWIVNWLRGHPGEKPEGKKKLLPNEVYNQMRAWLVEKFPRIPSLMVNGCIDDVNRVLCANTPKTGRRRFLERYQWEAVVNHSVQIPDFSNTLSIPINPKTVHFCYAGKMAGAHNGSVGGPVFRAGKSAAVMSFLAFSKKSGRENTNLIFRIETRQKSPGDRKALQAVAAGDLVMAGSKIIYREEKRAWFINLCYMRKPTPLTSIREGKDSGIPLTKENTAIIEVMPKGSASPFKIIASRGGRWYLSDGAELLKREWHRLIELREKLRADYGDTGTGRKGHGRKRFEMVLKKKTHQMNCHKTNYCRVVINEVLRFLRRFDCGTVVYNEPSQKAKDNSWFSENDIPFPWAIFSSQLANKFKEYCIASNLLEKKRRAKKAVKELVETS